MNTTIWPAPNVWPPISTEPDATNAARSGYSAGSSACGTRLQAPVHVEQRRMRDDFRARAERFPGDEPRPQAAAFVGRQVVTGVMRERRLGLFVFYRQRHPRLDAVHRAAFGARPLEALGMRDAAARGHPVHLAGADRLLGADAVAMHDLAFEQVGDGRQADVRMRPHIDGTRNPRLETNRAEVVEEDERPDHPPLGERQHASDFEAAKVAAALVDDELDHQCLPAGTKHPPTLAPLTAPQGGWSVGRGGPSRLTCKL